MKSLKKIISLTMAAVMIITATPILQAKELLNNLNTEEFRGLMADITSTVENAQNKMVINPAYGNIPNLETLKARYNIKIKRQKGVRKYAKSVKQKAKQKIDGDPRYNDFTDETQERLAFNSVLLDELTEAEVSEIAKKTTTNSMKILDYESWENFYNIAYTLFVLDAYFYSFVLLLFYVEEPKIPYFKIGVLDKNPAETIKWQFLEDPYYALYNFGTKGADDFTMIYYAGEDAAQLLWDAVDLRYYAYKNPTYENLKDFLYPQTIDWQYLTYEKKIEFLHNAADRMRAERDQIVSDLLRHK